MAKRTTASGLTKEIRELAVQVAEAVVADHFFDPDQEDEYKNHLSRMRASNSASALLEEFETEGEAGAVAVRLEALKAWTELRLIVMNDDSELVIEGSWSFTREEFAEKSISLRRGTPQAAEANLVAVMGELEGPDLDLGEDDFLDAEEEEDEFPDIGDNPAEPPPATADDGSRLKAIARRLARMAQPQLTPEDDSWLQQTPQTLPLIVDSLVAELARPVDARDPGDTIAWRILLAVQLEYIRYRLDRGWEWAASLIDDFQQRLIRLGEEKTIGSEEWMLMASALAEARIPVSESVQAQLAEAGLTDESVGSPEEMMEAMRSLLDNMAELVSSPFDVVEGIQSTGGVLPGNLRSFMAMELSLSPHPVLREAVPLMLLDQDAAVRRDAAQALEQMAKAGRLSGDTLRRMIAVRNWLPTEDRPAIDAAIRSARLNNTDPAGWPQAAPGLEFHVSMIDGSGAQSILIAARGGRKGLFGGLLLRHGEGVKEAWFDDDVPRGRMSRMLKEATDSMTFTRMDQRYADIVIQHAIATGTLNGAVPPHGLLQIAERLGGPDWQDRHIDVAAEADTLVQELPDGDRSPEGVAALLEAGATLMDEEPLFSSWYEEGPEVERIIRQGRRDARIRKVMTEVIQPHRGVWAEKFLLMALWSKASQDGEYRARTPVLAVAARALAGDRPLADIPAMQIVAEQTVDFGGAEGWLA